MKMCASGGKAAGLSSVPTRTKAERRASPVIAPNCGVANAASIDVVRAAAFGGNCDWLRLARKKGDAVGLDHGIDHERTARLSLTITAVTTVDEHWCGGEPIAHISTGTTTLKVLGHPFSLRQTHGTSASPTSLRLRWVSRANAGTRTSTHGRGRNFVAPSLDPARDFGRHPILPEVRHPPRGTLFPSVH